MHSPAIPSNPVCSTAVLEQFWNEGHKKSHSTEWLFHTCLIVSCYRVCCFDWRPHRESNPDLELRRFLFYPLNYRDDATMPAQAQPASIATKPQKRQDYGTRTTNWLFKGKNKRQDAHDPWATCSRDTNFCKATVKVKTRQRVSYSTQNNRQTCLLFLTCSPLISTPRC